MRDADDHRQGRLSDASVARAPRRTLHVAALPFPSPQGTQAALDAMLRALVRAGREPRLLCYATGAARGAAEAFDARQYPLDRGPAWSAVRSLRSGPSAAKVLADAALVFTPSLRLRPNELLIAHHVEAAAIARLRGIPAVFFAHTDLEAELPSYAPALPFAHPLLARAGGCIDRALVRGATAVATVSPLLAERMAALGGPRGARVRYVPVPWLLPPPITGEERAQARARFGLSAGTQVVAYAGNLDGYQGWPALLAALAQLNRRTVQLLVATASDPTPLLREARTAALADRVRLVPLAGEEARRALHAAADLVAVPRSAPGGLPIKLLDALARGVPCAIAASARAGLPLHDVAQVALDDDGPALAAAIAQVLADAERVAARAAAGRAYVAEHHSDSEFLAAFDEVLL